ncbi:unannotated protein [freshwater metagenome]|uniref:Unannotated protein n=1 Tax=freshwater metagenome TaxID=449393 RepID=A0A6J5Z820_9ZZZZ|nr:hypothetical protein [Actinomycetota bacterium]
MTLHSPLSGPVNSGFGGGKKYKSKIVFGVAIMGFIPFLLSTFAASVTVGNGALEFGQGSQQAIACDSKIYIAMGEEWHANPSATDPSAGYFRVRAITVSNLDLQSCAGKKLRIRLINGTSQEIGIGPIPEAKVLQVTIPAIVPVSNIGDSTALLLSYLTGTGTPISGTLLASAALSVSGTSIYDGSVLNANSADVTFFIDPAATTVNIDGQSVFRTTVETIDNPSAQVATPTP